jgi:sporulation protein YlmC with PRC-barrel domain
VIGLNVYNNKNEKVGSINDLLMDKTGNIKVAVISIGGFLGGGTRLIAVSFDKVRLSGQPITTADVSSVGTTGGVTTTTGGNMTMPPITSPTGGPPATAVSKSNPWYPDHAVFNATKEDLKSMSEFRYSTE